MNKITEYTLVSHDSPIEFNKRVNEAIKAGWQPIGGVSYDSLSTSYLQAMIRYEQLPITNS